MQKILYHWKFRRDCPGRWHGDVDCRHGGTPKSAWGVSLLCRSAKTPPRRLGGATRPAAAGHPSSRFLPVHQLPDNRADARGQSEVGVDHLFPSSPALNQSAHPQDRQVVRDGGLGEFKTAAEAGDVGGGFPQGQKDAQAGRIAQQPENFRQFPSAWIRPGQAHGSHVKTIEGRQTQTTAAMEDDSVAIAAVVSRCPNCSHLALFVAAPGHPQADLGAPSRSARYKNSGSFGLLSG